MFDPSQLQSDLQDLVRLAQEILTIIERENVALRSPDSSNFEAATARKNALPNLEAALARLKTQRAEWLKLPADERARHPQIAALMRQNQDVIMKAIVLDRENEQALLRKGLVPPRHLPSPNRQKPHYVADLYKRGRNG
jgi:hypothetical protein